MKPRIRYGVLDDFGDFGEELRWQWEKPSANFKYITQHVKCPPAIDWNSIEPALF